MSIASLLDTIVSYTSRANPAILNHLQPGYDEATIDQIWTLPYRFPQEAIELYQWHNGTQWADDDPWETLFYCHYFLPFEAAMEEYRTWQTLLEGYDSHLFPLFTYMGEYYCIWCSEQQTERGAIYFVFQGEGQVYDSLTLMLQAIAECYTTGAYQLIDGEYVPDEPRVAAIKAKWNFCRVEPDGSTLNYHP